MINIQVYIAPIISAVEEIGAELLRQRDEATPDGEWVGTQLKSSADLYAHNALKHALSDIDPDIPFLSEESDDLDISNRPELYWLVDPIDGTASYVHGYDGFVIQVALIRNNVPELGVVYAPATKECYSAVRGQGAYKNGEMLHKSTYQGNLRLIDNYPEPRRVAQDLTNRIPGCIYVESGSLGLKALRVADGAADVFVKDVVVRDWDFAAPLAIINETDVKISQYDGAEFKLQGCWEKHGVIVSRDSGTHDYILDLIIEIEKQKMHA